MAEKTPSIKKNMIMNAILTMSKFVFPIITFPYVSRILHATGTGKVDFAGAVVSYFAMFAQLGIPQYGVKEVAKVREDKEKLSKVVHELLLINLLMSVVVYFVFGISLGVVPKFRKERVLLIITSLTIILNAFGIEWMYKGLEKYTYITTRALIFKVIGIIAMFLMVKSEEDYVIYGCITIFATAASDVLNFINARKYIYMKPMKGLNLKQHRKPVLIFFSMAIATTIYTNLDKVMLGFMKDDEAVGFYGAAVKIKHILLGLVTSASTVLLPRASYYVDKGKMDDFYHILKKTMHLIILMAVPFCVYFMIFANEGITFLSGTGFEGSIIPMIIIMPTLILIGITNVSGIQMMVPLGMEKQVLYSEVIGAIIDLVLNAILIPKFSVAGAAMGTLFAEVGVTVYQLNVVRSQPVRLFKDVNWIYVLVATVISFASVFWLKMLTFSSKPELNCFIKMAIAAVISFGLYGIILLICKDRLVKEIMDQVISKFRRKAKPKS